MGGPRYLSPIIQLIKLQDNLNKEIDLDFFMTKIMLWTNKIIFYFYYTFLFVKFNIFITNYNKNKVHKSNWILLNSYHKIKLWISWNLINWVYSINISTLSKHFCCAHITIRRPVFYHSIWTLNLFKDIRATTFY